jgi:hypothetical protein
MGVSGALLQRSIDTMTDFTLVARRRETTLRQAKRFSEKLNLPQMAAKDVLARAFYRCAGWEDLLARLSGRTPETHIKLLAALPHSTEARDYFRHIRRDLAKSLSQHVLTNSNLVGLHDLVQEVFAVGSEATTLADVIPTLTPTAWRSAGIGPDPWSVLEADVAINGVVLRLVATRTYMPRYYAFSSDTCSPECAEPYEGKLRIIWTEPASWRQAALDYLNDEDAEGLQLPQIELTESMARHQEWFDASLSVFGISGEYGDHGENFLPHIIEDKGCYIVFGVCHRLLDSSEHSSQHIIPLQRCEDSFSQLALLGDTPICLEWISIDPDTQVHTGEFGEYFASLRRSLLGNRRLHATPRHDGAPGVLLVLPSTEFDVRHELKVDFTPVADEIAFVLKTNDTALARELLRKAAARDLMALGANNQRRYLARIIAPSPREAPSLSLSIETVGPNSDCWANLVLGTVWTKGDGSMQLLVEIAPRLLTLMDKMGRKATEAAINQGLILRQPAEFAQELDQPPSRCERIPTPPDDIRKLFEERPSGEVRFGYTRYKRDNF